MQIIFKLFSIVFFIWQQNNFNEKNSFFIIFYSSHIYTIIYLSSLQKGNRTVNFQLRLPFISLNFRYQKIPFEPILHPFLYQD